MSFSVSDMVGLTDLRHNLSEIIDEVANGGNEKIIIKNNKGVVVLVNAQEYEALQDRVLAVELEASYRMALVEEKQGKLITLNDLATKYGFKREDFTDEELVDEQE